jgi:hypothetical protein
MHGGGGGLAGLLRGAETLLGVEQTAILGQLPRVREELSLRGEELEWLAGLRVTQNFGDEADRVGPVEDIAFQQISHDAPPPICSIRVRWRHDPPHPRSRPAAGSDR